MKAQEKRRISTAVLAAIGAAGILAGFQLQVAAQSSGPRIHNPGEIRWAKGRVLVQARAGLTAQELDKKIKVHGGRRVGSIEQINVHIVELPPQANERTVAQMLKADPHIKFAEVDEAILPAVTPNDPAYANAWHLPKIRTPDAWNSSVGEGVTIAILDTGVDATHPDLVANLVAGYNAYDNNSDTRDVEGHGTETSGAAAMAGNNLIGSAGVSFKSKIMPIRVTYLSATGYHSTMAKGLIWAADHGARVASMSFARVCGSSTIWNAAQYMRNKGGVVIGAAGNSGALESMAASETMTCVSATGSSDTKTSWSSYGSYVDVAAPGAGIYTTRMGGGYGSFSGTSYSAPITAAVYALMMSANRSLGPSQLDAALFSTAVDLGTGGKDTQYGYGRVDAAAAVAKVRAISSADTSAPSVAITSPAEGAKVNGLVAIDVSANDNVGVSRVDLYAGGTRVASDTVAPYAFSWVTSALADGQSTLEARAVDAAGNIGSAKVTLTIANDLNAPSVSITSPQAGATITGPTTVGASATDDKKVATISLSINGKEVALSYGSSLSYQWDPYAGGGKGKGTGNKRTASGSYTLKATATDAAGNVRSTSVGVTVP